MNFEQIASSFERVYRYSAAEPDYNGIRGDEPLGFELPTGDGSFLHAHTPRKVAAMWLEDQGRPEEAEKVQWHDGPLLLHQGKVKKGQHTLRHVLAVYNQLNNHLDDLAPGWQTDHDLRGLNHGLVQYDPPVPEGHFQLDHDPYGGHGYNRADRFENIPNHEAPSVLADVMADEIDAHPGELGDEETTQLLHELRNAPTLQLHPDEQ